MVEPLKERSMGSMAMQFEGVSGDEVIIAATSEQKAELVDFLKFCQETSPMETIDIIQDGNTFPEELEEMVGIIEEQQQANGLTLSKWQVLKINTLFRAFTELGQSVEMHGGPVSDERLHDMGAEIGSIVEHVFPPP